MMRLVVRREQLLSELADVAALLRHAKEAALDAVFRKNLTQLIEQSDGVLDEFKRYYVVSDVKCGAGHSQYARNSQNAEDLVSFAFASAAGLESAKADGFELPEFLRGKVKTLAQAILSRTRIKW